MRWKFQPELMQVHVRVSTHQALALLAVLHPCVPAAVGEQAVLVQTLAAQSRVALGAAEQVGVRVVAVANHPAAHHLASLSSKGAKTYHTSTIKHWTRAWIRIYMHACEAVCLTESLNMHVDNKYCNKGYVAPLPSNCFEVVFYAYSVSALTVGTHTRLKYVLWILMHSGSSFKTVVFEEVLLSCLVVSVIWAFFHIYKNCCGSELTLALLSYSKTANLLSK